MEALKACSSLPGFGFHPTDVELISHYLRKKLLGQNIEFDVIPEVEIYKHEPWDLPAKCNIPTKDTKWHFFAARDRKYPNGSRANRATEAGYWKSTGKDRNIKSHSRVIGTKKTLVFHIGRPPYGKRSDWIMHEYNMNENECRVDMKNIFVLCRVTKRNGLAPEEGISSQINEIDDCPGQDVDPPTVKQESFTPSIVVDDYETLFEEFYNPHSCAVATIDDILSEPKAEMTSLAPMQEPVNSSPVPSVSDDLKLYLSSDDIDSILQSEPYDFSSNISREFNKETIVATPNHETITDVEFNDFLASLFSTELIENNIEDGFSTLFESPIGNQSSSFLNENVKEEGSVVTGPKDDEELIQIRERHANPCTNIQKNRIRLQKSTLERRKSGLVRTLKIANGNHHVDIGHHENETDVSHVCGTFSGLNISQSNKEIKATSYSEGSGSKGQQISISNITSLWERKQAEPSSTIKSSSTQNDHTGCIQGAIGGILRGCSSIALNCLFLIGMAALIIYFLMRDAQRFLSFFSSGL